uniref:Kinase-like protein n=1 Tax=Mycena chlorophos TaxID=658473 RepID=A0ABQ0LQ58_MYCCL|nr:kinase-like protein [Mycena chlorophos]
MHAVQHLRALNEIAAVLNMTNTSEFRTAMDRDEQDIANILLTVVRSRSEIDITLSLQGSSAQALLLRAQLSIQPGSNEFTSKVLKLMGKLATRCYDAIPTTLFITGITECTDRAVFFGGFSDVFKGVLHGQAVALKRMRIFNATDPLDPRSAKDRGNFVKEAFVWQTLQHKYIVPFIGVDAETFSPAFSIVSPWMKNGTVRMFLAKTQGRDRIFGVNRLLPQISEGLEFLHSKGMIHGDLRGANILVDDQENACLVDFGLTVLIDAISTDTTTSGNRGGNPRWTAPEDFDSQDRSPKSDVFSLGCLYTDQAPLPQIKDPAVMWSVRQNIRSPHPPRDVVPDYAWLFMESCWDASPTARPDIEEVLATVNGFPTSKELFPPIEAPGQYSGWVSAIIAPIQEFIDFSINPHRHYLEPVEVHESSSGITLAIARLAHDGREKLVLSDSARQRDEQDLMANHSTFVAISIIPVLPGDNIQVELVHRELQRNLLHEHIVGIDAVYLDPSTDSIWLRKELMAMSLKRIIGLKHAGSVSLPDSLIARCIKDILLALQFLAEKNLPVKQISANNILLNRSGVAKLNKLDDIVQWPEDQPCRLDPTRSLNSLGALLWETATGQRPLKDPDVEGQVLTYAEFMHPYLDNQDWPTLFSGIASRSPAYGQFLKACFSAETTYESLLQLRAYAAFDASASPKELEDFGLQHLNRVEDLPILLPIIYANLTGVSVPAPDELAALHLEDAGTLLQRVLRPLYALRLLFTVTEGLTPDVTKRLWTPIWRWTTFFVSYAQCFPTRYEVDRDVGLGLVLLMKPLMATDPRFRKDVLSTPGLSRTILWMWQETSINFYPRMEQFRAGLYDYLTHACVQWADAKTSELLDELSEAAGGNFNLAMLCHRGLRYAIDTDDHPPATLDDDRLYRTKAVISLIRLLGSGDREPSAAFWKELLKADISSALTSAVRKCFDGNGPVPASDTRLLFSALTDLFKHVTDPRCVAQTIKNDILWLMMQSSILGYDQDKLGWAPALCRWLLHRCCVAAVLDGALYEVRDQFGRPEFKRSSGYVRCAQVIDVAYERIRILEEVRKQEKTCGNSRCLNNDNNTSTDTENQELSKPKLRRCGHCNNVAYCDAACQRADWEERHRWECLSPGDTTTQQKSLLKIAIAGHPDPQSLPHDTIDVATIMHRRNGTFLRAAIAKDLAAGKVLLGQVPQLAATTKGVKGTYPMHLVLDYCGANGQCTSMLEADMAWPGIKRGYCLVKFMLGRYKATCELMVDPEDDDDDDWETEDGSSE